MKMKIVNKILRFFVAFWFVSEFDTFSFFRISRTNFNLIFFIFDICQKLTYA